MVKIAKYCSQQQISKFRSNTYPNPEILSNKKMSFNLHQHLSFLLLGVTLFSLNYIFFYLANTYLISGIVTIAFSTILIMNILGERIYFNIKSSKQTLIAAGFGIIGILIIFEKELLNFKVEEYKRPTFEITFNDVKEIYTIGDTLKIKGNAKALAGSNITDAKVKYSISKSILDVEDDHSEYDYEKETTTDSEGNIEIELIANDEILKNNQIKSIRFKINAEITDLNGETITAKKEVYVDQKTILLTAIVNKEYFKEDNNKLTIKSTNYNFYPVDCKGEIKIYQIKEKSFLIDRNLFPEIQNITKEEFKNLFPHEPYEISDLENETILTKTLYFDTQKSKEINLNFLRTLELGKYKVDISTIDKKGDTIQITNFFTLNSKLKPIIKKHELFTFKTNDNPELSYFEIL
mgnify:CR=1 FL=1